jgi:FAD/FMN-containing dehydrogenase
LRGGGGNFGVVTSFLFRTHPAKIVYGGPIIFDMSDAAQVMRWYRDFQTSAPEDFCIWLGLQTVPPGDPFPKEHWGKKMCALLVAHNGANAEAAVNAVRAALPKPLIDWAGPLPYPALQGMFDALYPKGLQWYWKGDFVKDLPDAAIAAHLEHSAKLPTPFSAMHLYPIDGAVHRRAKGDTAWNCRDATWSMVIVGVDTDPKNAPALRKWARDYWAAVHPHDRGGAYPNFMMDDEADGLLQATYGENYGRLGLLKSKYDPTNLFHVNHNIRPA